MKKVIALLAVMVMLVLPAVSSAAGVGYDPTAAQVQTTQKPKPASSKNTLPFTGLEVSVVAIAGLALLGTGFGLRKLGSARSIS
jgi:hypothetical protein